MKFLGKTPLSAAVKQAAEALRYTEEKSTVILITDGLETCEADPCALGKELEQSGVDFTAHVVGFGLTADEGREVACLAENTGGKYLQASDAAALKEALTATVVAPAAPPPAPTCVAEPAPAPAPEPAKPEFNFIPEAVMAAGGEPLKDAGNAWEIYKANVDGTRGEHVTTDYNNFRTSLEPGDYVVEARLGEAEVEQKLKVEAGQVYTPVFTLNAGTLIVRPRAAGWRRHQHGRDGGDRLSRRQRPLDQLRGNQDRAACGRAEADGQARQRRGHRDHAACGRPDDREGRGRRHRPRHGQRALCSRRRQGRFVGTLRRDFQVEAEARRHRASR